MALTAALLCAGTALLPAAAAAGPATAGTADSASFAPRQVVVKFEGRRFGRTVDLPGGIGVRRAAAALRANPRIAYAVPNFIATASAIPNDPGTEPGEAGTAGGWVSRQWNFLPCGSLCYPGLAAAQSQSLGGIDAIGAWDHLAAAGRPGGAGVRVAVLDTGIAYGTGGRFRRSPDFSGDQFTAAARDFVDNDAAALDENGHGTHVAGTIAEQTGNGVGVTGLAFGARLMPVRVLDDLGRGRADDIARGIEFAARHGADVINMSFNFSCSAAVPNVLDAVRFAHREGAVIVASVGNRENEGCVSPPATAPHVIGVGGTTEGACLGTYSVRGEKVDLVAPGGGVPSPSCADQSSRSIVQLTLVGASTNRFGLPGGYVGTSMAAAHVSGAAALVLASGVVDANPDPAAVAVRLTATARDLGADGKDPAFGRGLIDVARATDPAIP